MHVLCEFLLIFDNPNPSDIFLNILFCVVFFILMFRSLPQPFFGVFRILILYVVLKVSEEEEEEEVKVFAQW